MRPVRSEEAGERLDPEGLVPTDVPDLESTADRWITDLGGLGPFLSVGRYRYLEAQEPLPLQMHPSLLVLAFPIRGRFEFVVDGESMPVEPGRVILIAPGSAYSTGVGPQTRGELLWLVSSVGDRWVDGMIDRALQQVIGELIAGGSTVWQAPALTRDLLLRVVAADRDGLIAPIWGSSLCAAAVTELARANQSTADAAPMHPGVRRALDWLDQHADGWVGTGDLVEASGMSSTHFYEQFTRAVGTTPKDYMLERRIDRARELLVTTSDTVTDIAHALGFGSSQHFGTAFRRYVGMSPTEFRRNVSRDDISRGVESSTL
ncbi:helix-turn-helix domain-containing protein [Agromyces sp. NPDC058064]|uniref:helix-turn-helix transcriptional regulator n=1 Tax=Agromyces sp. NPDC058064 TaxID=3346322 RepID=UPI0036DEFC7D